MSEEKPVKEQAFTLYSVTKELSDLLELQINPETGEIDEEIEAKIEGLEIDRKEKIFGCIRWIKNNRATAEALKAEAEQMAKRAKVFANAAARCEQYVDSLTDKDTDKGMSCEAGALGWTKSTRTEIEDAEKLPPGFYILERKPKKAEIKKALQAEAKLAETLKDSNTDIVSPFKGAASLVTVYNFKVK